MGYYGSQNGNKRRSARSMMSKASERFRNSLSSSDFIINYASDSYVRDNHNFDDIESLLYNSMSQAALVQEINTKAQCSNRDIALSIAFTWYLHDFNGIDDSVCNRLTGLSIFSAANLQKKPIEDLFKRCPNIKSLTLAYMDATDAVFFRSLLVQGLLPNLEFVEVSHFSDSAIASMASAPNLREIVFRFPDRDISNDGFKRLVMNGGAENLRRITGSATKGTSNSLTKNYLKAILPKFVSKQCGSSDLKTMVVGPKVDGAIPLKITRIGAPLHPALAATASVLPASSSMAPPTSKPAPSFMASLPKSNTTPLSMAPPASKPASSSMAPSASKPTSSFLTSLPGPKPVWVPVKKTVKKVNKNGKCWRPALGGIAINYSSDNIQKKVSAKGTHHPVKIHVARNGTRVYHRMLVVELKDCLRAKGLKVSGRKAELLDRLLATVA